MVERENDGSNRRVQRENDGSNPRVPLTTRTCAFICLVMTVALTLYGYMRGFYYSFIGPFIIIVCIVILVKGTRQQRRSRRSVFLEGPLHLTESETELARHNPMAVIRRRLEENGETRVDNDAQESLLQRYDEAGGHVPQSTWIWRRPPSYCFEDKIAVDGILPPSYQDALTSSSSVPVPYEETAHDQDERREDCSDTSERISLQYEEEETLQEPEESFSRTTEQSSSAPPPPYVRTLNPPSSQSVSPSPSYETALSSSTTGFGSTS